MHGGRRAGDALSLAQECGLFRIAFDQMDHRAGFAGERTGDHEAGEAAARAEIDPDPRGGRKIEQLERIRDMPGPQLRDRGRRDEIGRALPAQKQLDEAIEPLRCFT